MTAQKIVKIDLHTNHFPSKNDLKVQSVQSEHSEEFSNVDEAQVNNNKMEKMLTPKRTQKRSTIVPQNTRDRTISVDITQQIKQLTEQNHFMRIDDQEPIYMYTP